ncbi:hypothetical protein FCV25MIE_01579 [Fagus crenata]
MVDELVEEWRKFSLTEDEGPGFTIEDDAMADSKALGSHCLLGKLWTEKYFNHEVLKATMLQLWGGAARGITAYNIGENVFVFQFRDDVERCHVLKGTPWLFDNCLLLLKTFDGSCPASRVQFQWCCFWVQFHDIPLFYMMKQTRKRIGGIFGHVEEVDVPETGVGWGPYLRV